MTESLITLPHYRDLSEGKACKVYIDIGYKTVILLQYTWPMYACLRLQLGQLIADMHIHVKQYCIATLQLVILLTVAVLHTESTLPGINSCDSMVNLRIRLLKRFIIWQVGLFSMLFIHKQNNQNRAAGKVQYTITFRNQRCTTQQLLSDDN